MYKYLDKVKITDGFYEGWEGRITGYSGSGQQGDMYEVEIEGRDPNNRSCYISKTVDIPESYLKKIEKEK